MDLRFFKHFFQILLLVLKRFIHLFRLSLAVPVLPEVHLTQGLLVFRVDRKVPVFPENIMNLRAIYFSLSGENYGTSVKVS